MWGDSSRSAVGRGGRKGTGGQHMRMAGWTWGRAGREAAGSRKGSVWERAGEVRSPGLVGRLRTNMSTRHAAAALWVDQNQDRNRKPPPPSHHRFLRTDPVASLF